MNRHSLTRTIFGAAALLAFAACTQDELAGDGTQLPEGKYPLEITSVSLSAEVTDEPWGASEAPQTRVAENPDGGSSHWTDGDEIGIKIGEDGTPGRYRVDADGTGSVTGVTAIDAAYWTSTAQATVAAYYPTTETVSLADQSDKLSYVLQATVPDASYNKAVELNFTHALAKVRVGLTGDQADRVNKIQIKSFTSCSHTNGANIQGSNEGWITMMKVTRGAETVWEANVVPGYTINKVQVNGTEVTLSTAVTTEAAKVHTVTITAEKKTVTITDDYIVEGKHKPIIITGTNPTVTFKNAYITSDGMSLIQIAEGCSPKLVFEGETMLYRSERNDFPLIVFPDNTKLSIEVKSDAKLAMISNTWGFFETYSTQNYYETLDISGGGELYLESNTNACPPIVAGENSTLNISNVTLTAVATECKGNVYINFTPAIGISGTFDEMKPTINMKDCTLRLYTQTHTGADAEHWVYVDLGTATPDVDNVLKDAEWGEPVDVGNGVKATKYKTPADAKLDWVDKLLNQ